MTPIIFKTTFDTDTVWTQNKRIHKKRRLFFTLFGVCLFAFALGSVLWFWVRYRYTNASLISCVLISALLVLFYAVINPALVKKRIEKTMETAGTSVQTTTLYEDHLSVHSEGLKGVFDEDLQYSSFSGVWETPEMFLFMNNKTSMVAIDKRSVSGEELHRARTFLMGLFPGKQYKNIS